MTEKRHQCASNLGFILAAAGSAVGLGNIWKFPGKVGAYGGGAFLIPYFLFVALFSYVGLSGEFALGRLTGTGAMGSLDYVLRQRGRRGGRVLGAIPLLGVLGIAIGIAAALIMNKTAFRGKPVPFVMELPNYRLPSARSVALLLWEKAKDFLQRAFTVIFWATIVIWFLQSFDTRLNVVSDSSGSLLALIGQVIAPIFAPMGFGDWRCATSLISGFIAKESVVSTLGVLLGGGAISGLFTTRSALSFLVFTLLYTPCVAAVATIRRELDSSLKTLGVVAMQCGVAWLVSLAAYALAGLW